MAVRSSGRTAFGRVLRKQTTAPIQNTVVGQPGTKMPIVPNARNTTPKPSRVQRATGCSLRRDRFTLAHCAGYKTVSALPLRHRMQTRIGAAAGDQVGVTAFLDDAAVLEHQDAVGRTDGRQAVGDDDGGPSRH